jgi:predicted TIM-barrel fold metal-dependent hydrolase
MHTLARSLVLTASMFAGAAQAQTPAGDYHQHVFSAQDIAVGRPAIRPAAAGCEGRRRLLDAAGIRKATLLSIAYMFGKPGRQLEDEPGQVRRENDWTAAQAARYPDRLVAFCSFNPLKDYALQELKRCAGTPGMARGIKLHFGNSDIQLDDPVHVARLREVFAAANAAKLAIVVHMRASISKGRPYGARQANIFIEQLLPAAPDVTVQVAHFAGSGPGLRRPAGARSDGRAGGRRGAARSAHPQSVVRRRLHRRPRHQPGAGQLVADTIRQVGPGRVLYGTDSAQGGNLRPRESWEAFRKLPSRTPNSRRSRATCRRISAARGENLGPDYVAVRRLQAGNDGQQAVDRERLAEVGAESRLPRRGDVLLAPEPGDRHRRQGRVTRHLPDLAQQP